MLSDINDTNKKVMKYVGHRDESRDTKAMQERRVKSTDSRSFKYKDELSEINSLLRRESKELDRKRSNSSDSEWTTGSQHKRQRVRISQGMTNIEQLGHSYQYNPQFSKLPKQYQTIDPFDLLPRTAAH